MSKQCSHRDAECAYWSVNQGGRLRILVGKPRCRVHILLWSVPLSANLTDCSAPIQSVGTSLRQPHRPLCIHSECLYLSPPTSQTTPYPYRVCVPLSANLTNHPILIQSVCTCLYQPERLLHMHTECAYISPPILQTTPHRLRACLSLSATLTD